MTKKLNLGDLVPLNLFSGYPVSIEVVYANRDHPDNHFPGLYHEQASLMWAHRDMAAVTLVAARLAQELYGWTLKINDCLRPVEAQEKMAAYGYHPELVSVPGTGGHPRAMAIDLEPLGMDGQPVDMGTPFDYLVDDPVNEPNPAGRDYTAFPGGPAARQEIFINRVRLEFAMRAAADACGLPLWPLPQEWWDFRFPASVYDAYGPLRESDLYPYQRLLKPDMEGVNEILAGKVPPELQKSVDSTQQKVESVLQVLQNKAAPKPAVL